MQHDWPTDTAAHVWSPWKPWSRTKIWRFCIHPRCNAVEEKEAPK